MMDFLQMFSHTEGYILVWTLPDKISRWIPAGNIQQAADVAEKIQDGRNVYIGAGLSPADYGSRARCEAENILGIGALWLDVDIISDAHKKKNLPETEQEARDLIYSLGLDPTFVIHSGNGLQAWWKFREFWQFDSPAERQEAAALTAAFNNTFRIKAAERGWDVDATHDLARVMRMPGTLNHKSRPPKEVHILENNNTAYNQSDFEDMLIDRDYAPTVKKRAAFDVKLNTDATPPFDKFEALLAAERLVRQSWERIRKDLQDQSASSYDMSLAMYAVQTNWTDQEIVDLLIASRRKHGDDLKLRQDYYERTIGKARDAVAHQMSMSDIEDLAEDSERAKLSGTPLEKETSRQAVLKSISNMFNVQILRVVKFLSDPPQYRLDTAQGRVMIGEAKDMISYTVMKARIFATSGVLIRRFKVEKWDAIVQALGNCCEEEFAGAEATEAGTMESWLTEYLAENPPEEDNMEKAAEEKRPYIQSGQVHIFGAHFRRYIELIQRDKITPRQMGIMLRNSDAKSITLAIDIRGHRTSRSVWVLPQEFNVFGSS